MALGVISDRGIMEFIRKGRIYSSKEIKELQIQPSSIDLTLGSKGFCLPSSEIPIVRNLEEFFQSTASYEIDLSEERFLHSGQVYVVKLNEGLKLPEHFRAKANPKSSTGRVDVHVRLLCEKGEQFDNVPKGYKGNLWLEICPNSFDIVCKEGISLNQLRIFNTNSRGLNNGELYDLHQEEGILFELNNGRRRKVRNIEYFIDEEGLNIRLDLSRKISGYVAKKGAPAVNLLRRDNPASEYFEEVSPKKGKITVSKDSFYILNSSDIIRIPDGYCAEVLPVDTNYGEYRAHYAGFFDPGFNAQGVLELRNTGVTDINLKDRQKIAKIRFFHLKEPSVNIYGKKIKSNYQGQKGPQLAKFFDVSK